CHYYPASSVRPNSPIDSSPIFLISRGGAKKGISQSNKTPTISSVAKPTQDLPSPGALSDGVCVQDVEELVKQCIQDPNINIGSIPDWLEAQIYRATIQLTLNSVYRALHGMEGNQIFGHQVEIRRISRRKTRIQSDLYKIHQMSDAQEEVLEKVANNLLANKDINQPLIPDFLERRIYANCLKIVFRVLDLVAVSFRITLCGHDLHISLQPSTRADLQQAAMQRVANSQSTKMSSVDFQHMMQVARDMGRQAERKRWFWQRWLSPANNDFVAQLHASVYCLILGVMDDLLENTEIQILSDRIRFDLVPNKGGGNDALSPVADNTLGMMGGSVMCDKQQPSKAKIGGGISSVVQKSLPCFWANSF
ncbi:MAG: hypothetical protein SGILL_005835, partial [Bacillariaceae sp.]